MLPSWSSSSGEKIFNYKFWTPPLRVHPHWELLRAGWSSSVCRRPFIGALYCCSRGIQLQQCRAPMNGRLRTLLLQSASKSSQCGRILLLAVNLPALNRIDEFRSYESSINNPPTWWDRLNCQVLTVSAITSELNVKLILYQPVFCTITCRLRNSLLINISQTL